MKRFTKKAAAAAVVFSAALNFNGCGVYGPPVDDGEEQQVPYGYVADGSVADDEFVAADNVAATVHEYPVFMETNEKTSDTSDTLDTTDTAEQEE